VNERAVRRPEVGDVLEYRTFGGDLRRLTVEEVEDDIKNGRPGFGGPVEGSDFDGWGYDDQIVRYVR
jgi:hypothetical protein